MISWLFLHAQVFYKLLYFRYKSISDRKEINWIKRHLKKKMVAVDIGANIGFYSVLLSKIVGDKGKVYSFEPDEVNFRFLKKHTQKSKNISLQNLALSNKDGFIQLYLSSNLNVDHRTYKTEDARMAKEIACVTLDTFFKSKKRIDLIKIDVQGYDYFVLQGAQKLIRKQKKIAIVGEFWPYGLRKAGVNPKDYIKLLEKLELKIVLDIKKPLEELEKNKNYFTNFYAYK